MEYTKSIAENRLKERLFSVLLSKDYAVVTAVHTGKWMNRLTSDTVVVASGLVTIFPNVAGMLVKLISALILLLYLVSYFSWILIPGGIFFIVLTYSFRKILKRLHKNIQEVDGKLRVFLSERLTSLLVIRSFACEKQILEEAIMEEELSKSQVEEFYCESFSSINLQNVSFTYRVLVKQEDSKKMMSTVIENISLEIKKGEYCIYRCFWMRKKYVIKINYVSLSFG